MFSAFVLAAALTLGADGPSIIVRPAPPAKEAPVTKPVMPDPPPAVKKAAVSSGCLCSCGCAEHGVCLCGIGELPAATKAVAPARMGQTIQTTLRQPQGDHTHTCAAGHTWDHMANSGHVCTALVVRDGKIVKCGLDQHVQDPVRRLVTETKVVQVQVPAAAVVAAPAAVYQVPAAAFSAGGGCPNGNCANVRSATVFRRR